MCVWILLFYLSLLNLLFSSCVLFIFLNAIDQFLYRLFLNLLLVSVILYNKHTKKRKLNMCVCIEKWTNCFFSWYPSLLIIEYLLWRFIQYIFFSLMIFIVFCLSFSFVLCWLFPEWYYIYTCDLSSFSIFLLVIVISFFSWLLKNHSNKD